MFVFAKPIRDKCALRCKVFDVDEKDDDGIADGVDIFVVAVRLAALEN